MFQQRLLCAPMRTDLLGLYPYLVAHGYRHQGVEAVAAHLAGLRSVRAAEALPHRRLEAAHTRRLLGIGAGDDWNALVAATWLGTAPEPWLIDWTGAYDVTHTVFYLSDFAAAPHGIPDRIAAYLTRWLPVWTDIWSEIDQWDLLGELLAAGACLPEPYIDAAAWERYAAAQHEDGLMPFDARPVADDPAQRYRDHHHPTSVAAMAGALALSRLMSTRR